MKHTTHGSDQKHRLKLGNPTFASEQKKVLIHRKKVTCEFFKIIENKQRLMSFFIIFHRSV